MEEIKIPLPKPRTGEGQNEFISRCISFAVGDGMPQKQATAACFTQWRGKNLEKEEPFMEEREPKEIFQEGLKECLS